MGAHAEVVVTCWCCDAAQSVHYLVVLREECAYRAVIDREPGLVFTVDDVGMILNYGLNRVRFPAPLPVGSRVRMYAELAEALEIEGGIQAVYHLEFEIEGQQKPCCVADLLFRYYTNPERLGPAGAARPVEVT